MSTSNTFALPPSASESLGLTEATLTSGSHASGSSPATSRLQAQSLKAAAQHIGLPNGSMGMAMIDAIFDKVQVTRPKAGDGSDWGDVLRVLTGGDVC